MPMGAKNAARWWQLEPNSQSQSQPQWNVMEVIDNAAFTIDIEHLDSLPCEILQ